MLQHEPFDADFCFDTIENKLPTETCIPPSPSPHTHPIKKSPGHLDDEGNDPVARPLAEVHADREGDDRPEEVVPLMIPERYLLARSTHEGRGGRI